MKNENLVPKVRFKGFSDPWEQRKLGELSNGFTYGLNASAKAYDGKHQYLRITDIDDETRTFKQTHLTSPDIDFIRDNSYVLKLGDIVFTRTGASTGKTFIYRTADSIVYYAGFLIKMSVREDIDSEFVFQNTLTTSFNRFVKVMSQRSGQPGINSKEYARFKLYIPKLKEQVLVGNMLLLIDNLIAANEDKLEQLKTLKKLMMQKIFSQEWRFKGFTDPWEQRKLKNISLEIGTGKSRFIKFNKSEKYMYKILGSTSIIGYTNHFDYEGDFILTARVGANAGTIYRESGKVKISDNTVFIKASQINFLYYVLTNYNLKRLSFGTGQPLIKSSELNKLKLEVPTNELEQQELGVIFFTIDTLIAANEDKLNQLKELKKYLMQNMFV
ncbi:restriction endonuclease subunit S [Lactiplantibacillus plantarum]|jgi:type I restriction enzyme, S subunit|uniref:restriction endonuclease subunit S n=1 Tax=Lactiplantibacillus plantarum TaxID=1590 RepID=UPI000BBF70DD|nr:restriction endonuclease subunit S [Lactiplantibacillus plantarum]ASX20954.1 hypothetical protein BGV74_03820 [Lactiplantibacillus plantarum]MCG0629662.1 restriction endonuclease subunit S [Lactiplantibacillus plantarum]UWF45859.1 restriction endonuclease subunit S [Lactiplantibacillus plantarum]WMY69917.1 restriction endonuclease subunit S [Lactiplantibacillus plantarum]